jgi:hypothetical protein
MIRVSYFGILPVLVAFLCPIPALAQYDGGIPLGDLARSLRKNEPAAAPLVIDNDNLSQVMDEVESHRQEGAPLFTVDSSSDRFKLSSPDGTCSLSFNANATSLLTNPYVYIDLPPDELTKLDGPATIDGDTLQVTIYNGSYWDLKEITVGVTVVRNEARQNDVRQYDGHDDQRAAMGNARLLPAVAETTVPTERPADLTRLVRLTGSAAPMATSIFRAQLEDVITSDQEWHWAIVKAKGVPPMTPHY